MFLSGEGDNIEPSLNRSALKVQDLKSSAVYLKTRLAWTLRKRLIAVLDAPMWFTQGTVLM